MASNVDMIDMLKQEIETLKEKVNSLEKKFSSSPSRASAKPTAKNIPFEEAFEACTKGTYPCMYLPKSGKNKGNCCGIDAVFVDTADGDDQVKIDGKVSEDLYHSLRCAGCQKKGRANSESKKKCTEKIRGINVNSPNEVNQKVLSFLSGNTDGVASPTRALTSNTLPTGTEVERDDCYHYIVPFDGNNFVFEHIKNKNGTPCIKKTPTLRGFFKGEEIDKDDYVDELEDKIPEEIYNKLKDKKKFKFEGEIIKPKVEEPVVPQLKVTKEPESEDKLGDDEMDEILNGLNIE